MRLQCTAAAIALVATMGATSWAQNWNKKTTLDVKETILIPGKELPPGKYVMKLADVLSNRHIVQVFNENESQILATILAIPNHRMELKDGTELRYWETPAGVPPALRAWFYPGDNFGQEFAYPKAVAEQIAARNNNAQVAWYEGPGDAETLRTAEIHSGPAGSGQESASSESAPVEKRDSGDSTRDKESTVAMSQQPSPSTTTPGADRESSTATTPSTAPESSTTTTPSTAPESQSTASQSPSSTTPQTVEPSSTSSAKPADPESTVGSADRMQTEKPAETPAGQPATGTTNELPRTASPLWTIALAGAAFIGLGVGFIRRNLR